MLRHPQIVTHLSSIGVSAGTAGVLGLHPLRQADVPTTAYLMVGSRCLRNCAFCTQARDSMARARFLSRVAWPLYSLPDTLEAIKQSFAQGEIARCCLQVTVSAGHVQDASALVQQLRSRCSIPVCTSIAASDVDEIEALLASGVERVSLALDAACERVYRLAKGQDWQSRLELLRAASLRFPGHIGTHLIAGLGETEQEMVTILQDMVDWQVTVGLFAFTPVPGTAWARRPAPPLSSYRRIQAAWHLLVTRACRVTDWIFSPTGHITSYGLSLTQLRQHLSDGRAFQTIGCPGCNRPYYNERPGKVIYNYPRPLTAEEIEEAISAVLAELEPHSLSARVDRRTPCSLPNGV